MNDKQGENTQTPTVFVSYSWSSKEHETWVENLAKKLRADGINALLDKWEIEPGNDISYYMERIGSKEIAKILAICDNKYTQKANDRTAGVGTEAYHISKILYSSPCQNKVIPILMEKDEEGNPILPAMLAGRRYIDFTDNAVFDSNYEKLKNYICGINNKPPLGQPAEIITHQPQALSNSILYERREQVFDATKIFLDKILADAAVINDDLLEFNKKTYKADFIFNNDIVTYLAKIRSQALLLRRSQNRLKGDPRYKSGKEREEEEGREDSYILWLAEASANLKVIFKDFLTQNDINQNAAFTQAEGDSGLKIKFKKYPSNTGELHKYWLLASFTNNSKIKQTGFALELLFPSDIPIECFPEYNVTDNIKIEGLRFKQYSIHSDEAIYRNQDVQAVDTQRNSLSYQMNNNLYYESEEKGWKFIWRLYLGNLPIQQNEMPWHEMHNF